MERVPEFRSEYLQTYMQLVEDTESPRLYHLWAAMSGISAALGRRCYLPFGGGQIWPNQFILLVGNPGTRKSSAMKIMAKMLRTSTHVRFAPQDTAGQRQGLALAMQNDNEDEQIETLNGIDVAAQDDVMSSISLADLGEVTNRTANNKPIIADADKHTIYVAATEFSRFIGQNNLQMLDFLTPMWDGEDYEYRTKTGLVTLKDPLINMLACTTPSSIATSMPPEAGGQGFLSRMILVYGARKYKEIARPHPFNLALVSQIKERLSQVYYDMHGAFSESPAAFKYSEDLYKYTLDISDSRFSYYAERRFDHLLKLGMALAASRGTMTIERDDYDEAHRILRATESGMPDALGQFGMSPLAQVKQGILEFLRGLGEPTTPDVIRAAFHRDARPRDISEAITDLVNSKQLIGNLATDISGNQRYLISAKKTKKDTEDEILQLLAEK